MRALPAHIEHALPAGPDAVRLAIREVGGTPLRSGDTVTLLHVGVADAVHLRHWLDIFPAVPEFHPLEDGEVWATTFTMEPDARIEYKIAIRRHGRQRLVADALNPLRAGNPWGANSELRGAAYREPEWAQLRPGVARGVVTRHEIESKVFDSDRALHVYRPVVPPEALLVVHDGDDYLQFASMAKVLDNLIGAHDIAPVAAVFVDPGDRMAEYRADRRHAEHIVGEVLPFARAETNASRAVAIGASLGGVASLHAAWSHPGVFDALVLQAGSFVTQLGPFGRGPVFRPVIDFMRRFAAAPGELPGQIHVSCGRYDGLIGEARMMSERFSALGVDVGYADVPAGHDWHAWRDLLRQALMHVFPRKDAMR